MMTVKDYEIMEEKIEKEIEENNQKINEFTNKIKIIERNSNKNIALKDGLISFGILTLGLGGIIKYNLVPLNLIPYAPYVYVGVSTLIGIIGQNLHAKKYKLKEKLREFSSSKTSKERLQEKTKYQIELKKAETKNQILNEVYSKITRNKVCLEHILMNYNVTEKEEHQRSKEERNKKITSMKATLKKYEQKLNLLSTKLLLSHTFWNVRDRSQSKINLIFDSIEAPLIILILGACMNLLNYIIFDIYLNASILIAPIVIGGIGAVCYQVKKMHDENKVFQALNKNLGASALPDLVEEDQDYNLELELEIESKQLIEKVISIRLKLEKEQVQLKESNQQELQLHSREKELENISYRYIGKTEDISCNDITTEESSSKKTGYCRTRKKQ